LFTKLPLCTLENQYSQWEGLSALGPLAEPLFQHQDTEQPTAATLEESPFPERGAADIPVAGARLGRDADGAPAWFVADPLRAGKYLRVEVK
jgi:hypothetical protein